MMQKNHLSIHFSLIKMLIIPLGLFLCIVTIYLYYLLDSKVNKFFDNRLLATAYSIEDSIGIVEDNLVIDLQNFSLDFLSSSDEGTMYYSVVDEGDNLLVGYPHIFEKYKLKNKNKIFYDLNYENQRLRAFSYIVKVNNAGKMHKAYISVAENMQERKNNINELLGLLIMIMSIVVIITISTTLIAVKKGLSPLRNLQKIIRKRDNRALEPIEFEAPKELEDIVNSINILLKRSRDSIEYIEKFNSDVSHQLRTPLAELKMKLSLIYEPNDKNYKELDQLVNDMAHITEQLLLYAKTNPDTTSLIHLQTIDLNKFCKDYSMKIAPKVYAKGFEYAFDNIEEKFFIDADTILLESMLDNIVSNALRYAVDENGTPIGAITLSLERQNNTIWLNIKDEGYGLDKKHLRKIFKRFYRVDTEKNGSGLGLSIVRQIALLHKAKVLASNNQGLKISVIFHIPKH
jgi:two-component system sensor histidine kinase TctE